MIYCVVIGPIPTGKLATLYAMLVVRPDGMTAQNFGNSAIFTIPVRDGHPTFDDLKKIIDNENNEGYGRIEARSLSANNERLVVHLREA
jgi:hypothetical protein